MTGRPREFDRNDVLERAMRAFWAKGFERTGLPDLQAAMGIGRQSLYGAFGDKRTLFLESLDRYGTTQFRWLHDRLAMPGSGLENVRSVLDTWVDIVTAPEFKGCLVCNSIVEFGRDAEVTAITERHSREIERSFHAALQRALDDGDLRPGVDTAALAQFIANLGQGLALQGRSGLSRDKAAMICGVAQRLLDDAALHA